MLPIFTIIGRPNVGKSTLFNSLTQSRNALVLDQPGVTRDRQYGQGSMDGRSFIVVDTGGIADTVDSHLTHLTKVQVQEAIEEAGRIFFVVDAKSGLTAQDQKIVDQIRKFQDKVILLVNKIDGDESAMAMADFYALG